MSEETKAYVVYHDHRRGITFRWDGHTNQVEVHSGGLADPQMEIIEMTGVPFAKDDLESWLRWFESNCQAHIRMRLIFSKPIVEEATNE